MQEFPKVEQPKKQPPRNDFDGLVEEVKEKIEANDVFGMKDTLQRVQKNIPKNHPRRAEMFKVLNEGSKGENVFIKGDCTGAAIRLCGEKEIPELLAMFKEKRNVFAEDAIFNQLAELKDPSCAEPMVELLSEGGFNPGSRGQGAQGDWPCCGEIRSPSGTR